MKSVAATLVLALAAPALPGAPVARGARGPRVVLIGGDGAVQAFALPVPETMVTERDLRAPHHDYPASDLMVPAGTPVFAAASGRVAVHEGERCGFGVSVTDAQRRRFVSCHLERVSVSHGTWVEAGDVVGLSGDTGNARGVPHLHFHVVDPRLGYVCPQPLFLAWFAGRIAQPGEWRRTEGCSFPRG